MKLPYKMTYFKVSEVTRKKTYCFCDIIKTWKVVRTGICLAVRLETINLYSNVFNWVTVF